MLQEKVKYLKRPFPKSFSQQNDSAQHWIKDKHNKLIFVIYNRNTKLHIVLGMFFTPDMPISLKLSPCFSYSLKLLSALNAILKAIEQTKLTIKMGQTIHSSVLPCSFCCCVTFCWFYWFSLYTLHKWKKIKQMGQNTHFHTDIFTFSKSTFT